MGALRPFWGVAICGLVFGVLGQPTASSGQGGSR
jgi:hypothetical protein